MMISTKIFKLKYGLTLLVLCFFLLWFSNPHAYAETISRGKFYVIGTGPAGPEHATCKAIECIKKADVVFCSDDVSERFSIYLKGKTMGGNPWRGDFKFKWKDLEKLKPDKRKAYREERIKYWDKTVVKIKNEMAKGKTVALLDSGDPCVFGPSHRIIEGFDPDEVEIIPGLGCFQASMAALKKSSIPAYDTRFVMLTAPFFLLGKPENEEILKDMSKYPITMGIYMALKDADSLIGKLKKYYPHDLPAAVVYNAGYPEEKVVKGTLDTILDDIKSQKEKWLGMIIIGRCLDGQPQRGMIKYMTH
jgi:precorrin-4 methylase